MGASIIRCIFHGNLIDLLPRGSKGGEICYPLKRRASIKDIIESFGVPHTEVGRIDKDDAELTFAHIAAEGEEFHIHPFSAAVPVLQPTTLRPEPFSAIAFMADDTVRRLARNLRMAGLDTAAAPDLRLKDIGIQATQQQRILLSRNRDLLKCSTVCFGQLLRSENHIEQLREVLCRFSLEAGLKPFIRCIACNTLTEKVDKQDVLERLEPLTRKYYFSFRKCPTCDRIYWHGSHAEEMERMMTSAGQPCPDGD